MNVKIREREEFWTQHQWMWKLENEKVE